MPLSIKHCIEDSGSRRSSDNSPCNRVGAGLFARLHGRGRSVRLAASSKDWVNDKRSTTAGRFFWVGNMSSEG